MNAFEKIKNILQIRGHNFQKCPSICEEAKIGYSRAVEKAIEIINQVESEYNNGWIPCSERLPKEKGWYQCTCADKRIWTEPIVRDLFYYPKRELFVDNIRYSEHGCVNIEKYDWTKYVVAWQPLPDPYKGE